MKRTIIIIAILLIAVSLYTWQKSEVGIANQESGSTSSVDTSNWKTYVSQDGEWEIAMPATFKCKPYDQSYCNNQNKRVVVPSVFTVYSEDFDGNSEAMTATYGIDIESVRQKPANEDFLAYITQQANLPRNTSERNIAVKKIYPPVFSNGYKMVKVETVQSGNSLVDVFYIEKVPSAYIRIFLAKFKPQEASRRAQEIGTILSNFKFTNQELGHQSSVDASNWKTYRDEKYGVEIKHPQNYGVTGPEYKIYNKDGQVVKTGLSLIVRENKYIKQVEGEAPGLIISDNKRIPQSRGSQIFSKEDITVFNDVNVIPIYFRIGGRDLAGECMLVNLSSEESDKFISLCNQILSTFKFTK